MLGGLTYIYVIDNDFIINSRLPDFSYLYENDSFSKNTIPCNGTC